VPGIVGIIGKGAEGPQQFAFESMLKCMLHEQFYSSGSYVNNAIGLRVGWTGFKSSYSACLPIWNEKHDVCLIFSGDHYADRKEKDQLRNRGHESNSKDVSHLMHLYEELDFDFFKALNGSFSGVLVDFQKKRIILFVDRYGLNRIYYHKNSDGFYFSSEAKSLLKVLPKTRSLDFTSLGEYFSCGCALQNRSLFAGISLLPGGSMWRFSFDGKLETDTYFRKADFESQPRLTAAEYHDSLSKTFPVVLKRYLNSDQKTGVSLTGGVDSRMVMAWANCSPNSLPCYTFAGEYRDSADVKIARTVANICRQPHEVIRVGRDFLKNFPSLAESTVFLTDGAMDVSGAADLYVNRVARQIAPIRLTGNYGGEILRELVAFKPVPLYQRLFDPEFTRQIQTAGQTYGEERKDRPLSFIAFKQVPWHHYSRLSLERSQIPMRTPYLDNDIVRLAYQTPIELTTSNGPSLRMISKGNPLLATLGTDRGLLSNPIPFVTRFQHLSQELTFKAEYAYDYGMPHWLAKVDSMFSPLHFERLFLGRHKFHHFRTWYRNELSSYLKDVLLDSRSTSRPYLCGPLLEKMVMDHIQGTRNYTLEFHRVLSIELLQRQLID